MLKPAQYSAVETLRDGSRVEIPALRQEDRTELLAAVGRTSAQSLYRRFFGVKRGFTDSEVDFFMNIDFARHVALVAVLEESGREVRRRSLRRGRAREGRAGVRRNRPISRVRGSDRH